MSSQAAFALAVPLAALALALFFIVVALSLATWCRGPKVSGAVLAGPAAPPPSAAVAAGSTPPPVSSLRAGDTPVAVVVENHALARPPFGLERAAVVYEAPAEGGITRFVAIFALDRLPEVIGPVRSVRPYLVDWAEEWRAAVFHSGGSPEALAALRASRLADFDEISWNGRYFWRAEDRRRPHDLFTSAELITQAFADYRLPTSSVLSIPWGIAAETSFSARPPDAPVVRIETYDPGYCVAYRYQRDGNRYERWLAGKPHLTAGGEPLYAKSVVVQEVPGKVVDREGRLKLAVDAGGWAIVFSNGQTSPATWESRQGQTTFVDAHGDRLGLPEGPVWVTIVLDHSTVKRPTAVGDGTQEFTLGCDG